MQDPTEFRERFKAYKDGKKPYENGKTVIGSNVDMKDDGTFTDDYTRAFDDLIVTPQGPRVKPGQLHKYQEPWDDEKFMNAVTVGGLNNLSPSQWARRILDFQNGELTVDSWLNGNNGIVPDDYAKEHPGMAAAANTLFDFWTLGGPSMIKNAKNWAQLARSIGKQTPKQTFTFDIPEEQAAKNIEELPIPKEATLRHELGGELLMPADASDGLYTYPIEDSPNNAIDLIHTGKPGWGYNNAKKMGIQQVEPAKNPVYRFPAESENIPEETYTGGPAKTVVSKEELGQRAHQILNPEIFTQELKALPKPEWYDETFVDRNGKVNIRAITRAVKDFYKTHPNAVSYKEIRNSSGNLYQHIKDVVKSAQEIPVPEGYTRQELVQSALFHDIGKVFERGRSHDKVSAEMLDDLGINVSDNVKNAVKHHMSQGMLSRDELTKALHFADVARGESWDEAAFKYPHLAYEYKKPELNIPKIPYRDELKTRINPWLKNKGYETIPLDVSEEEAWRILEERIDQHRSFLRGVRDPVKEDKISANDIRNAGNVINQIMDDYGIGLEYASSDDATEWRLRSAAQTVPRTPTGHGRRSHLYGDFKDEHGLVQYERTPHSKMIGADPDKKDALYVSTSDDVANNYSTANTDNRSGAAYVVELPKIERVPGESMSEHLLKNDFEMIDLNQLEGARRGTGSMYEDPYRLQTGRSLQSDMIKEGAVKPKYVDNPNIVVKPGDEIFNGHRRIGYDQLVHAMEETNKVLDNLGISFQLNQARDNSIYMPRQLLDLRNELNVLNDIRYWLTPLKGFDILQFDSNTQQQIWASREYMESDPFDLFNSSTFLDKMPEDQRNSLLDNIEALQDENYMRYVLGDDYIDNPPKKKYPGSFPSSLLASLRRRGMVTQKQIDAAKKAFFHNGDPLKYLNLKSIADKRLTSYLQSIKKNIHKKRKIDPTSLRGTPEQMAEFVRSKGVLPRYEIEGYGRNKVYTIDANEKNKTKNAGDVKRTYGYILGDKGEKILDIREKVDTKKSFYSTGAGKDDGSYSKRKISRKTLRALAPIIAGSSTLKPRQKDEEDKTKK